MNRAQKSYLRQMVSNMAVRLSHKNNIVISKYGCGLIDADRYEAVAVWLHHCERSEVGKDIRNGPARGL